MEDAEKPCAQAVSNSKPATVRVTGSELERPPADFRDSRLTVSPLDSGGGLTWVDPAGYAVARGERPADRPERPALLDFELTIADAAIVGTAYLRHV
jgi:hypothetical protein